MESSASMQKAIADNDPALFRFAAHAFKSASNNIGAAQLSALCGRLEKITEAEFGEKGLHYFTQVERELDRVKVELESIPEVSGKKTGSL